MYVKFTFCIGGNVMLKLATEIRRKCSVLSICQSIVANDLGKLYCNDTALSKKLNNLSPESVSALMPILAEMIV